jgi:hypothetical protein
MKTLYLAIFWGKGGCFQKMPPLFAIIAFTDRKQRKMKEEKGGEIFFKKSKVVDSQRICTLIIIP